ncbi:sulfotransferase [Alicyclobacillus cellulosilyticus]|uniref:Sulfotransferase n=1 Tax=Alicyclobacillus cellulosilyticus TaxID=1003997 RepID=A0A917NG75_9BACL|nr:sulfotransferase [Alicyclobacillus cellulosilyticus]GGI97897.1 sulfotransferase [Alicyclobacillus cellulosilyticus]
MRQAAMPTCFIVGAAKCGTTSLDRYLNQHPDIYMAPRKETHFFASPDMPARYEGPGDEAFTENLIRSLDEYQSMFAAAQGARVRGESSVYYLYFPKSLERIARTVDHPKVIAVLRNPVDRAYSAYMHLVRDGRETLPFLEALAAEPARRAANYQPLWHYTSVGLYARQVEHLLRVFGREHVLLIEYEEFNAQPERTLAQVFHFLGVDERVRVDTSIRYNMTGVPVAGLYQMATQSNALTRLLKPFVPGRWREKLRTQVKNLTLRKEPLSADVRAQLLERFRADILALEAVWGRSLAHWLHQASPTAETTA